MIRLTPAIRASITSRVLVSFLQGLVLISCNWAMCGEIAIVSRDSDGTLLRHGGGWLNGRPVQAPVANDGRTAFIAPMPEFDNSPSSQFHASYLATTAGTTLLQHGVDPFSALIGNPLRTTNTYLASNDDLNFFAILCDERNNGASATTSTLVHLRAIPPPLAPTAISLGNSPDVQTAHCRVAMDASGSRMLTYGRNIAITWHVLVGHAIVSTLDLTEKIPYQGERIAMSGDGDHFFFASDLEGYGLLEGQNGIFCYRLSSDSLTFICPAGSTSLDSELAVSADAKVVVFRRRSGALAVAAWENGLWTCSDDYPIRGTACLYPAISADGRYVVCAMAIQTGDALQIYRYDRWRHALEMVSENNSGQAADADCYFPAVSPDGRQVTFISASGNLVDEATDNQYHVYRRELESLQFTDNWMVLNLRQGWNPVAIPFSLTSESLNRLQDHSGGSLWGWDTDRRRYFRLAAAPVPGQGFWLHVDNDASINVYGTMTESHIGPDGQGWHLLGPAEVTDPPFLQQADQDAASPAIFGFHSARGRLVPTTENRFEYGRAYWTLVK